MSCYEAEDTNVFEFTFLLQRCSKYVHQNAVLINLYGEFVDQPS